MEWSKHIPKDLKKLFCFCTEYTYVFVCVCPYVRVCVVTNTIYSIAIMLTSLQCLQSGGFQSWWQKHIKSWKAIVTIPCKFISRKPWGRRLCSCWEPHGVPAWAVWVPRLSASDMVWIPLLPERIHVTVLDSIKCTLTLTTGCVLSTFLCILGFPLCTRSSLFELLETEKRYLKYWKG